MSGNPSGGSQANAISAKGLTKTFGRHRALKGVDLEVAQGEFLAIFGPNGSGKTTLIRTLASLMRPTSGRVLIMGLEQRSHPAASRRMLGVVTHDTLLYQDLTAYENLQFYGRMYGIRNLGQRIQEVIHQVAMAHRLHDRVRTLSHGMQKRITIARALLHDPPVLLLDEPESGLDQEAAAMLEALLTTGSSRRRAVVMATHNLERGLKLADRAIILFDGRIVHQESRPFADASSFRGMYLQHTEARQ